MFENEQISSKYSNITTDTRYWEKEEDIADLFEEDNIEFRADISFDSKSSYSKELSRSTSKLVRMRDSLIIHRSKLRLDQFNMSCRVSKYSMSFKFNCEGPWM